MNVKITDRFELRTFDKLNMRLYEYRPKKGEVVKQWCACDCYFRDVPSAVAFVYRRLQRDDPYEGELKGAIARMESIAEMLAASVGEAEA